MKPLKMKISEKQVENKLLDYLENRGCFPCKIERQGTFDRSKGIYRMNKSKYKRNGISDIMFFYKDTVYFCEVKTPEKYGYIQRNFEKLQAGEVKSQKTITTQIEFLWSVRKKKQVSFFCDSVERLKKIMQQPKKDVSIIEKL